MKYFCYNVIVTNIIKGIRFTCFVMLCIFCFIGLDIRIEDTSVLTLCFKENCIFKQCNLLSNPSIPKFITVENVYWIILAKCNMKAHVNKHRLLARV